MGVSLRASPIYFLVIACSWGISQAWADVYKCSTDNGSITLSNVEKGQNCKKMVLPPPEAKKPASPQADKDKTLSVDTKPANKPKNSYEGAAAERKRIIQEEMDLEKVRLNAVQSRIKDLNAISNKSPEQAKDLASLQQKETLHSNNLQLLQKELAK